MMYDGLCCAFDAVAMGAGTERYTGEIGGITRERAGRPRGRSATSGPRPP